MRFIWTTSFRLPEKATKSPREYASRPFNGKHRHVSPSLLLASPLVISHRGPLWVTPPISKEAFIQDRHLRDGPRDKPTELCVKDP
ncbi:hypothetical protein B296_00014420 [Ensete ventricosum]|uniref:Uncharacterized protein n=1 Tax=Ensete ventricosum TaxID=4639 RepID=A0A427A5H9_ENSVE|nr:hypothetical protein B296_00014420 [Ensete ventricosum]